jgi:hypothetical protein
MRVTEDYLRVTRWYAKAFEQGSSCMPQGMDADLHETGVIADPGERADEVTRLDWPARASGEDQAGICPRVAEPGPVGGLLRTADA